MLQERARAKVNLYLHVVGRRPDGYHLLDSLAVFPDAADILHAEPSDSLGLHLAGRFGAGLAAEPDNLVLRAARALAEAAGIPARAALSLEKNLPIASGIGGGSADAAAALRLLARLWRLDPGQAELARIAARLGADVPVCLASSPMRMGGVGEILTPAPSLPRCGILLVNPGVAVSTPAVFRARTGTGRPPATLPSTWSDAPAMAADLAQLANDLEAPATSLAPEIGHALHWIRTQPGCLLARMSGSGATCFGLFASPPAPPPPPPAWWTWFGQLSA